MIVAAIFFWDPGAKTHYPSGAIGHCSSMNSRRRAGDWSRYNDCLDRNLNEVSRLQHTRCSTYYDRILRRPFEICGRMDTNSKFFMNLRDIKDRLLSVLKVTVRRFAGPASWMLTLWTIEQNRKLVPRKPSWRYVETCNKKISKCTTHPFGHKAKEQKARRLHLRSE